MANKLDPMDIKQIISLHKDGLSNRRVGISLGISRNTINTYIKLIKACSYSLDDLIGMDYGGLQSLFPVLSTIDNERYKALLECFDKVNQARKHPGFTFQYHHQEYSQLHKNPYSYTQFMEHYNRKHPKAKGSMKLDHQPGHEVFIDFAGKKMSYVDKQTGEQIACEVFVAILPNSHYTYVEACLSQKREDFVSCMANTLSFYGGVPKAIVCDNLKSAVNRASKYEAQVNRAFKDFASHYDCIINPTRSYRPQDKALVENAVNLTYQRIYHPLREMIFHSLKELNEYIGLYLDKYNDLLLTTRQTSRKELFQSVECTYLKPLPATAYQIKDYCKAKVQKMGYVYFSPDKNHYSVPYRHIGKHTQIHYTKSTVEVYYNFERIAIHHREKLRYVTNEDHLSSTHKAYSAWSSTYFKKLAEKHGQNVLAFITGLFTNNDYPEINYKRAMGVIQLHKDYGSQRLDKACRRALYTEVFSYNMVKNILSNGLENDPVDEQALNDKQSHIPTHDNIRGASSYQ